MPNYCFLESPFQVFSRKTIPEPVPMELNSLFDQLHSLPTIPKVAQDLILQFDNPNTSLDAVARNIALDPVIAAKVLRLANSARFRGAREASSVEDAASRLGFNTLRTLVLASAVTGAFKTNSGFDLKGFWLRSSRWQASAVYWPKAVV